VGKGNGCWFGVEDGGYFGGRDGIAVGVGPQLADVSVRVNAIEQGRVRKFEGDHFLRSGVNFVLAALKGVIAGNLNFEIAEVSGEFADSH
jgi:hypothetical protein